VEAIARISQPRTGSPKVGIAATRSSGRLQKLREDGLVWEEEYQRERKEILDSN
jgi:hypothetical protein